MKRRVLLFFFVVLLTLVGFVSFLVSTNRAITNFYNSNAAEWGTYIVIEYMETHDGQWPRNWDDLREPYETCLKPYGHPWPLEELQRLVDIDWNIDPSQLTKEATFRAIWLRDASQVNREESEPNRMIMEYLQKRKAKEKKP